MDYLTLIGGIFIAWLILVALFAPHIPYQLEESVDPRSEHFIHVLESTCNTSLNDHNKIEILTNGPVFYPAMIDAIRSARESINLECYIFRKGEVADRFLDALCDRAAAGIHITVVLDAIGSFGAFRQVASRLNHPNCRVYKYQPLRWHGLARLNNRTHREILVIDGRVAFVGGAGVADWWFKRTRGKPMWRDMMARIEGPLVSNIQGIVAENWLECCGEILTAVRTYQKDHQRGASRALAIRSSPADRATLSRVLLQMFVEAADHRVLISTPYFLPDKAFRRAFARTAQRGVEITVIVPGTETDQRWVRLASRRMWGELLKAGVRIFEFGGGMTHVKALLVDDLWSIIGTTNVDNRSFEHNDEVNVAVRDEALTARIASDLRNDISQSREVTLAAWKRRPMWEKLVGRVAWILERQQ
jgi:cardiolipin synthase